MIINFIDYSLQSEEIQSSDNKGKYLKKVLEIGKKTLEDNK